MTDQQFCLRWNNHQSTLVAVFDGLLEKGVLVDCTLAAEGQQLTAHKVVLAACSPFLETLLSRHYDKHPILILKDVKFTELKAMMDYMYRGEVNISQDQLGTFLKAAESLQIKGLSDGGGDKDPYPPAKASRNYERKPLRPTSPLRNSMPPAAANPAVAVPDGKRAAPAPPMPYLHTSIRNSLKSSPLLVDIPEDNAVRRDGSLSPLPRKKKRARESEDVNPLNNNVVCKLEIEEPVGPRASPEPAPPRVPSPDAKSDAALDKTDPVAHLKHELIEEEEDINEDSMELTLDEDDVGEAGPSHNEGDFNDFYGGSQDGDNRDSQADGASSPTFWFSTRDSRDVDKWINGDDWAEESSMCYAKILRKDKRCSTDERLCDLLAYYEDGRFSRVNPKRTSSESEELQELLKVSWEAWRAATGAQDTEKTVPNTKILSENPISVLNQCLPLVASTNGHGAESPKNVECGRCGRRYKLKSSLRNHQKWECGKEPRFQCPYCVYRAKQKMHVERHIERMHKEQLRAFYDANEHVENQVDNGFFGSLSCELMGKMMPEGMTES